MEKVKCSASLQHPFTCIVSGPTQSGKTEWVLRLIENHKSMIEPSIQHIIFCYAEYQPKFEYLAKTISVVKFTLHQGTPSREMIDGLSSAERKLLILDDLMEDAQQDDFIVELFTRGSHHRNPSILLITQNLFTKGRHQRTISLNANYLVIMKNPRDRSQITYLARQIFPGKWRQIQDAYDAATARAHGYLFIDLTQNMDDRFRLRTNIFDEKRQGGKCVIFVPKVGGGGSGSRGMGRKV